MMGFKLKAWSKQ